MNPPSSISGYYFGHENSRYFSLGPIGRDQVEDYSSRKKISVSEAEKWLQTCLGYESGKHS